MKYDLETIGKMVEKMYTAHRLQKQNLELENLMTEEQTANLLGVTIKTLQNKFSKGELEGYYTIAPVTNKRIYFKNKVLGIT